jgi:hypothetical protein
VAVVAVKPRCGAHAHKPLRGREEVPAENDKGARG